MNVGYFVASKAIISPLTKADRFLLVFRVHLVSSTIWNRLQCRGTIISGAVLLSISAERSAPCETYIDHTVADLFRRDFSRSSEDNVDTQMPRVRDGKP